MRVNLLMKTPAITCAPNASVQEVCHAMDEHRVGCVIVVRKDLVAGIVTDRDIALRVVGAGLSWDIPVERIMTRNVARVLVGADVAEAEATMSERRVRRLPVVDSYGHVHGVVTLDDVVRHLGRHAEDIAGLLVRQERTTR